MTKGTAGVFISEDATDMPNVGLGRAGGQLSETSESGPFSAAKYIMTFASSPGAS